MERDESQSLSGEETVAGETLPGVSSRPRSESDSLTAGTRLGRYVLLERLGEGGMGVVYAAYDPELDRKVALKLLKAGRSGGTRSTEGRARLVREAQAMARLAHPNVVTVFDVGEVEVEDHARVFVAMEFVDGENLATCGKRRRQADGWVAGQGWREVVALYVAAGRGLAAAHAAGIVHRDFKPENVLLGSDGRVRVLDFGLARSVDAPAPSEPPSAPRSPVTASSNLSTGTGSDPTRTGALMGTPAYMSPEQCLGRTADERSDQFSFCLALWEALFGVRPYSGDTAATMMFGVTHGEMAAPPRSRVPSRIRVALERGLSQDPADRFPDLDGLLSALERDPLATARRWGGVAGVLAMAGMLGYGAWAATRPGRVAVRVEWNGEPLVGARVQVGGVDLVSTGDGVEADVAAGLHPLRVVAPGFVPHDGIVEVKRGGVHDLSVTMRHEQGTFELDVEPVGATVLVDDVDYGSRLRNFAIDTGPHVIDVRKVGHYSRRLEWTARTGQVSSGFAYLPLAVPWSASASGANWGTTRIGDATGDGRADVAHQNFNTFTAYDPWEDRILWTQSLGTRADFHGTWAQLDGDGVMDLVGVQGEGDDRWLTAWSSRPDNGRATVLWRVRRRHARPMPDGLSIVAPYPVDVDADGRDEVVVASIWDHEVALLAPASGRFAWKARLPGPALGIAASHGPEGVSVFVLMPDQLAAFEGATGRPRFHQETVALGPDAGERATSTISDMGHAGQRLLSVAQLDGVGRPDVLVRTVMSSDGGPVRAFSGDDGRLLWEGPAVFVSRRATPPLFVPDGEGVDVLLAVAGEGKQETLTKIDGVSGEASWRRPGGAATVAERPGGLVLAHVGPGPSIDVLDPATGAARASHPLPAGARGRPAIADLDGDGAPEVAVATSSGEVLIFDPETGEAQRLTLEVRPEELSRAGDLDGDGFEDLLADANGPVVISGPKVRWARHASDALRSSPVVEDLDGDGRMEVVVFGGFTATNGLHIFDAATGELKHRAEQAQPVIRDIALVPRAGAGHDVMAVRGSVVRYSGLDATVIARASIGESYGGPALLDVEGDGVTEVVAVPWNEGPVRVLDAATLATRPPLPRTAGGWAQPRPADLDGDGRPEILIGDNEGEVVAVDPRTREELWRRSLGLAKVDFLPVVGDLEGDGVLELVAGTTGSDGALVVWRAADGEPLWRVDGLGKSSAPPVILPADADGRRDIIAIHGKGLARISPARKIRWRFELAHAKTGDPVAPSGPATVTDLEGDGKLEILATLHDGTLRVLEAETGRLIWSFHGGAPKSEARPAARDVDGDGIKEVFFASFDRYLYCLAVPGRPR